MSYGGSTEQPNENLLFPVVQPALVGVLVVVNPVQPDLHVNVTKATKSPEYVRVVHLKI